MKSDWPEAPETDQWTTYQKELATRKIEIKEGPYIIRWGKRIKGMFTIS